MAPIATTRTLLTVWRLQHELISSGRPGRQPMLKHPRCGSSDLATFWTPCSAVRLARALLYLGFSRVVPPSAQVHSLLAASLHGPKPQGRAEVGFTWFRVVYASCFCWREELLHTGAAVSNPDRKSEKGHLIFATPGMLCCPVLLKMEAGTDAVFGRDRRKPAARSWKHLV